MRKLITLVALMLAGSASAEITGLYTLPGGSSGQLQYNYRTTFSGIPGSGVSGSTVTLFGLRIGSGAIISTFSIAGLNLKYGFTASTGAVTGLLTAGSFSGTILAGSVDFSTITTSLNNKLTSGAIPSGYVNFSTITTAIGAATGTVVGNYLSLSTGGAVNGPVSATSLTVRGQETITSTLTVQGATQITFGSGNNYASRNDSFVFARSDLPTTWLSKITSSLSGTPSDTGLYVELANASGTRLTAIAATMNGAGTEARVGISTAIPQSSLDVSGSGITVASMTVGGFNVLGAWYSFTPTLTCGTGSLTSASATGSYMRSGKTVYFRTAATITTNGTCAGQLRETLIGSAFDVCVVAGSVGVPSTKAVVGTTASGLLYLLDYAGAYPGSSGVVVYASGVCEIQ